MSWTAIVGQPLAVRLLRQAVASGKVTHAYLFAGPEGVGKHTVALELAKELNCQRPTTDGACGSCPSCNKMTSIPPVHPDLAIVRPDGRFIKTDQIRELQADMYAKPNEGRRRIAIIDAVDRMNSEAGNRMLKLLEEPPVHAILVLLTHNLAGVLPTIISRCQVVNFTPLGLEQVAGVLQRRLALQSEPARLYAALSGGSIGRAVTMAENPAIAQRRDDSFDLLRHLSSLDDFALLSKAEALEKHKDDLDEWFDMVLVWLRDALLIAQAGVDQLVINADRPSDVRDLAQRYGADTLLAMLGIVTETRLRLQRNANTRLTLDVLLLHLRGYQQGVNGV